MSTGKTEHLQLNQWAATDDFLREEFNEDNRKIEAALAPLVGNMVCGLYKGNGAESREIELGFQPRAVFMQGLYESVPMFLMALEGRVSVLNVHGCAEITGHINLTANGISLRGASYGNVQNWPYYYLAIR